VFLQKNIFKKRGMQRNLGTCVISRLPTACAILISHEYNIISYNNTKSLLSKWYFIVILYFITSK